MLQEVCLASLLLVSNLEAIIPSVTLSRLSSPFLGEAIENKFSFALLLWQETAEENKVSSKQITD